ncbi:hypothetical protein [Nocardia sp. NPDC059239]|uniref:hypothetical protein n=1 Tax=Nocardia sp. NPDC059239 TaxID=3346785 RepID=UPI0036AD79A8
MTWALMTNIFGFGGMVVSIVMFIPNARSVWQYRADRAALAAVSLGSQILILTASVLWIGYSLLISAWWSLAPNVVTLGLQAFTIVVLARARSANPQRPQSRSRSSQEQASLAGELDPTAAAASDPAHGARAVGGQRAR